MYIYFHSIYFYTYIVYLYLNKYDGNQLQVTRGMGGKKFKL